MGLCMIPRLGSAMVCQPLRSMHSIIYSIICGGVKIEIVDGSPGAPSIFSYAIFACLLLNYASPSFPSCMHSLAIKCDISPTSALLHRPIPVSPSLDAHVRTFLTASRRNKAFSENKPTDQGAKSAHQSITLSGEFWSCSVDDFDDIDAGA